MSTLPQPNKDWRVAAAHEGRTREALALAPGDALTVGPVFQDDPDWAPLKCLRPAPERHQ